MRSGQLASGASSKSGRRSIRRLRYGACDTAAAAAAAQGEPANAAGVAASARVAAVTTAALASAYASDADRRRARQAPRRDRAVAIAQAIAQVQPAVVQARHRATRGSSPGRRRAWSAPSPSRTKRSSTRSRSSAGTPGPLSSTAISMRPSGRRSARTSTRPPGGVYLSAFSIRFETACVNKPGSPHDHETIGHIAAQT